MARSNVPAPDRVQVSRFTFQNDLDLWCQRGILALVLAVLIFGPLALGAVVEVEFLFIELATLAVLLLWSGRLWLAPSPALLWPPICWAVLAFALYAIGRYLTADIEYVARQELIRVLVYCFLFFAILNNLHAQQEVRWITLTLIFVAMAISVYAAVQFLTDSDRVWIFLTPYKHRGSGTFFSPNHLGGFLEMLLPLALAYTMVGRLKPLLRILVGYASLVLLVGIAVTLSRGSWISTLVALALLFGVLIFRRGYRVPAAALLIAIVAGVMLLVPKSMFMEHRLRQVLSAEGKIDDETRFALWRPAVQIWQQNILWGVGPAHFDWHFRPFRPQQIQLQAGWAHNDYLNTLADWGIVGFAIIGLAFLSLGAGLLKTWPIVGKSPNELGATKGSNKFALLLGGSLGLVAILIHSFVDFNMHIPANAIVAVTLMALLTSQLRLVSGRYWVGGPGDQGNRAALSGFSVFALPALLSLVLVGGAGYLGWQVTRQASESFSLQRASNAPEGSPQEAQFLMRAASAEPKNGQTAYDIGENLRLRSLEGRSDYQQLATQAMQWFEKAMKLNPWHGYSWLRYGMCLDWIGRQSESDPYFNRADALDPNGYFTAANIGLHYVQRGDYAAAKPWFERSLHLKGDDNPLARNYLQIANLRMLEAATNSFDAKLNSLTN